MYFYYGFNPHKEVGCLALEYGHYHCLELLQTAIKFRNVTNMQRIYDEISTHQDLPEPEIIGDYIQNDTLFIWLYTQLYYRQVRALKKLTMDQWIKSCNNYRDLFNYLLNEVEYVNLSMPNQWLWELMDEYVSQFKAFSHYRANLRNKTADEYHLMANNFGIWKAEEVIETLHRLIDIATEQIETQNFFWRSCILYQKMGHFAIFCLQRVHTLLADYNQAIRILDKRYIFHRNLIRNNWMFSRLLGCQFSAAYHTSFSYVMMHNYFEAMNTITSTLNIFQELFRLFKPKGYQNSLIRLYANRMSYLLCICFALRNNYNSIIYSEISKDINKVFRVKNLDDKLKELVEDLRGRSGKYPRFEEFFEKARPHFVLAVPPELSGVVEDYRSEAIIYQTKIFMNGVKQHAHLPSFKHKMESYFNKKDRPKFVDYTIREPPEEEPGLMTHLMRLKYKTSDLVWTQNEELRLREANGVHFYIDLALKRVRMLDDGIHFTMTNDDLRPLLPVQPVQQAQQVQPVQP